MVGAGWISQEAFLPGVWQTENSVVSAIVTGSEEKGRRLAEFHQVPHVFGYEQYAGMLNEDVCDAVYVALPNSMHAEYTIQAAKAGKHILVEKPLAVSLQEGKAMIEAAEENSVYLMTAYRLHSNLVQWRPWNEFATDRLGSRAYSIRSFPFRFNLRIIDCKAASGGTTARSGSILHQCRPTSF